MAWEQPLFNMSYQASKNLSTYQWEVVRITTAAKVANVTSATKAMIGVMQNNPTSGREANVMAIGVSKVKAGGAFSTGQRLKINSAATSNGGTLIAATCEAQVSGHIAVALQASAQAGDIVAAIINMNN